MTMTTEERLAALKARQAGRKPAREATPPVAPAETAVIMTTTSRPVAQPPLVEVPSALFADALPVPAARAEDTIRMSVTSILAEPGTSGGILTDAVSGTSYRPRPASDRTPAYKVPWERVSAGGAAVVSFVSMMVAMGPLFKGADAAVVTVADAGAPADGESAVAGTTAATDPVAPVVDIQAAPLDPGAIAVDPTGAQTDLTATSAPMVPVTEAADGQAPSAAAQAPATQTQGQAPATQAPATQAPATQAPATQAQTATTQPPATQAPTSQAPATQAPTTQPPTTAAPTTQPPATEPPTTATTAPPRSGGSGG